MKYLYLLLAMLLAAPLAYAQDNAAAQTAGTKKLDAQNGFRDVKYGTPITQIKDLELTQTKGDIEFYQRATDDMTLGKAKLQWILYISYRGKVQGVVCQLERTTNKDFATALAFHGEQLTAAETYFSDQFGPCNGPCRGWDKTWIGEKSTIMIRSQEKGYDDPPITRVVMYTKTLEPVLRSSGL